MADPSPQVLSAGICSRGHRTLPTRMLGHPCAKQRVDSKPGCTSWDLTGQVRSRGTEKRLEEAKLCRSSRVGSSGRPTAKANLLFLDYLGSPPKSSLALPCLTLALPETLIFPAPSVWICLLPNLSNA